MTDGEFNAPYCNGVTARGYNASSAASNSVTDKISHPSTRVSRRASGWRNKGNLRVKTFKTHARSGYDREIHPWIRRFDEERSLYASKPSRSLPHDANCRAVRRACA